MYCLIAWTLLRWLGAEIDYPTVLMVIGWSQVILIIHQALGLAWGILIASGSIHDYEGYAVRFFSAAGTVLPIMYVLAIGRGLQATGRVSFAKAVLVYMIVAVVIVFGLEQWYASKLIAAFNGELMGLYTAACESRADDIPWQRRSVGAGNGAVREGYPGRAGADTGHLDAGQFEIWDSAQAQPPAGNDHCRCGGGNQRLRLRVEPEHVLSQSPGDTKTLFQRRLRRGSPEDRPVHPAPRQQPAAGRGGSTNKALLISDAADVYYIAGKPEWIATGERSAHKIRAGICSEQGSRERTYPAQAYNAMGMAYDIHGNYNQALAMLDKVAKTYPALPEPWVRMAVTYDRMGNYKKAIDSANHAIKQLDSNAPVAWVALAQAFVNTGDKKQAGAAISMVAGDSIRRSLPGSATNPRAGRTQ